MHGIELLGRLQDKPMVKIIEQASPRNKTVLML
jgi:hypothetical protein